MEGKIRISELEELVFKHANLFGEKEVILTESTNLIDDLGYDSLSMVKLIIDIEEFFGIEMDEFDNLECYGSLYKYVDTHLKFILFYNKFIYGTQVDTIDNHQIVISDQRRRAINKRYIYEVIITYLGNNYIISCTSDRVAELCKIVNNKSNLISTLEDYLKYAIFENCSTRKMLRLIRDKNTIVVDKPQSDFECFFVPDNMKYTAKKNGKTLAYCKISDVINGFGNIVVFTEEAERRKGLASYLLSLMVLQCEKEGIVPMYLVSEENRNSLNLAIKMGFSIVAEEIVVTKVL